MRIVSTLAALSTIVLLWGGEPRAQTAQSPAGPPQQQLTDYQRVMQAVTPDNGNSDLPPGSVDANDNVVPQPQSSTASPISIYGSQAFHQNTGSPTGTAGLNSRFSGISSSGH